MKNTFKRLLSFVVALVMILGLLPVTQLEAEATTTTTPTSAVPAEKAGVNDKLPESLGTTGGKAMCYHCGKEVDWLPVTAETAATVSSASKHYYLAGPVDNTGATTATSASKGTHLFYITGTGNLCLHLNGFKLTSTGNAHVVGGSFNVMGGEGSIWESSYSYSGETRYGTIVSHLGYEAQVNLYGGQLKDKGDNANVLSVMAGIKTSTGYVNIYDAELEGNCYQNSLSINMYGGRFVGRISSTTYYTAGSAYSATQFNLYGGVVESPYTNPNNPGSENGGTFLVQSGAKLNISGGTIIGGFVSATSSNKRRGGAISTVGRAETDKDGGHNSGNTQINMTGGTIYARGTTYETDNALMVNCANAGGAVHLTSYYAEFNMSGGKIVGGKVSAGGAVYVEAGLFNLSGTAEIENGSATYGGNVAVAASANARFYMTGGTICKGASTSASGKDVSTYQGGGNIYIGAGAKAEISGGTVSGGTAMVATTANNNKKYYAPGGNIVVANSANLTVSGGTITAGESGRGGNIFVGNSGQLTVKKGTISDGIARYDSSGGGNIYMEESSKLSISGGTISGGKATNYAGGNINIRAKVTATISGGTISGGTSYAGGSIFMVPTSASTASKLTISGGKITGGMTHTGAVDTTSRNGGNIDLGDYNEVIMTGGEVSGGYSQAKNPTNGAYGGGNFYVRENAKLTVTGGTISGGKAISGGNILSRPGSVVTVGGAAIVENGEAVGTGDYTAGGNIASYAGTVNVNPGAIVKGGKAAANKGLEISAHNATVNVNGGTIGTAATKTNKAVYLVGSTANSTLVVKDGILYGELENVNGETANVLSIHHGVFSTAAVTVIAGDKGVVQNSEGLYEVHNTDYQTKEYCTEGGYTQTTCGYSYTVGETTYNCTGYKAEPTEAHTQTFKAEEPASCTATGVKAYYACSCGKNYEDEACTKEIADLSTWTIAQKAHSYTGENGACVNGCGKTTCENEGHAWGEEIEAKGETCIAKGNVAYYDCANCELYAVGEDKTITAWDQIEIAINAEKHSGAAVLDETTVKAPSCYEEGYTGDEKCPGCHAVVNEGEPIPTVAHTIKYKDITDTHHTSYCDVDECNVYEEKPVEHVYENDVCVCGKEKPEDKGAQVGDQKFDTLQEAVTAAKENGGIVKLLNPATVQGDLELPSNVKLDLAGQELKVEGIIMAAFTDTFITDTSADRSGRLVAEIDQLRLLENNPQLPVKMADGIMFVEAKSGNQKKAEKNYQCWIDSADAALINALKASNASDMALKFQVAITWGNNVLKYTFQDATVAEYIQNWDTHAMFLKITGAEGIEDLKYQARIVFADDTKGEVVVWAGDVVNHK